MKFKKAFYFWKNHWQIILILLLALFLRLFRIRELTTFGGDQVPTAIFYQFDNFTDFHPRSLRLDILCRQQILAHES